MISRRTLFVFLIVLIAVDMIQCGVVEDVAEAIHYDDIKKFTQNAATKTGEVATNAFNSVKKFFIHPESLPSAASTTAEKAHV